MYPAEVLEVIQRLDPDATLDESGPVPVIRTRCIPERELLAFDAGVTVSFVMDGTYLRSLGWEADE